MVLLAIQTLLSVRRSVEVGTDGVLLRWFHRQRFVPIATITRAEVVEGLDHYLVRVLRTDGSWADAGVLHTPIRTKRLRAVAKDQAHMIKQRIDDAIAARDVERAPFDDSSLLRGDRTVAEWRRDLRALTAQTETFRAGVADAPTLGRLVEDNERPAAQRVAAAIALSPHLDASMRARIATIARASAAPKLRVALEAVLREDDDRVADALADLEIPAKSARARA